MEAATLRGPTPLTECHPIIGTTLRTFLLTVNLSFYRNAFRVYLLLYAR